VIKISESLFRTLLLRTDAVTAVHALDQFWSTHLDPDEQPWFGLSEPEHHVHLCLIYTGEVGNGGHTQFFVNRGRDITDRVLRALPPMGLGDLRGCLERACRIFPDETVPPEPTEVERTIDNLTDEQLDMLQSLDREVWSISSVTERLLIYLRQHEDEVLRRERGLDAPLTK
jgi:hypothetical protein